MSVSREQPAAVAFRRSRTFTEWKLSYSSRRCHGRFLRRSHRFSFFLTSFFLSFFFSFLFRLFWASWHGGRRGAGPGCSAQCCWLRTGLTRSRHHADEPQAPGGKSGESATRNPEIDREMGGAACRAHCARPRRDANLPVGVDGLNGSDPAKLRDRILKLLLTLFARGRPSSASSVREASRKRRPATRPRG